MKHTIHQGRPAEILLVEDNEDDVVLTQEGLKQAKLAVSLHHVANGEECMRFLRKQAPYTEAPIPDLILLDLNMPVMDGREVLEHIVADSELRHIPVVVLTTSNEAEDIQQMYRLRCSSYITKPVNFDQFVRVAQELSNYWFTLVVLPENTETVTPNKRN